MKMNAARHHSRIAGTLPDRGWIPIADETADVTAREFPATQMEELTTEARKHGGAGQF